jgi:peptidoglycan hydrolase CwlO-like protein
MDKKIVGVGIFLLFLQTGCAVSDDPRQGGLMGYWYGTSSGKYEERQQERLRQIEEQKRTTQQLTEQSEKLNTELAIQDRTLAQEQKKVLTLEKQLASLNAKIGRLKLKSEKQRQEASALKEDIQNTKQSLENQKAAIAALDAKGGAASDPDQVRILEHERDRLADEYRKLNVYYQALSNAAQ